MVMLTSYHRTGMDRQLREARLRLLLDEMQRPMVYRLARGVSAPITPDTKKESLIDAVVEAPLSVLRRALAEALADADLRALCRRLGYTNPAAPDLVYRDKGWSTWGEFFGSTNIHPAQMLTAREAMPIVRTLGIRNRTEFMEAKRTGKLPNNVPLTIDRRPDWIGWETFLGTD